MRIILIALIFFFCSTLQAEWIKVQPLKPNTRGNFIGDIESHIKTPNIYQDADQVTSAHEQTHGINSLLRQKYPGKNGFYCLDDWAFVITPPKNISLSQVARSVPQHWRGGIYNLYLVQQQRYWNDTPLYPLDEYIAYLNGAIAGYELGMEARAKESFTKALEMLGYVRIVQRLCEQSNFAEQDQLDDFIDRTVRLRVLWLAGKLKERNWFTSEHQTYLDRYQKEW